MAEKPHYLHLDLFRGIAALLVFTNHVRSNFFLDFHELKESNLIVSIFYLITSLGHQGVIIFFCISGCVICNSIDSAWSRGKWSWPDYLINRLSRLWVVLIPALLAGYMLDQIGLFLYKDPGGYEFVPGRRTGDNLSLPIFLGNVCFLQTILVPPFGTNAVLWSLANEFWYYFIFPLFLFGLGNYRGLRRIICFLIAIGLLFFVGKEISMYFVTWLLGATAYYLYKYKRSSRPHLIYSLFFLGVVITFFLMLLSRHYLSMVWYSDFMVGFAFAFVIYWGLQIKPGREKSFYAFISRALSRPSYSLYVLHLPLLIFLATLILRQRATRWDPSFKTFLYALIIISIVLTYTYFFYRLTEAKTFRVRTWCKNKLHYFNFF